MKSALMNYKNAVVIGIICILTFLCFSYTTHNQFTNWDDDYYVTNDPYIKALTADNLKVIFTEDITKNNYHPLCMLSLAINYHFSQLNPSAYYLTNIIIHILNVLLVFFLAIGLSRRLRIEENGRLYIAGFCALWFGIHPMHVESVSWIAERKDVLYAFFYIAGLMTYLRYTDAEEKKWYWITFVLFIASCLSKPMAVVFPVSLLSIDILLQRKLSWKLITEKVIFFLVSLLFGMMAFYTQNKTGAIADFGRLTLAERVMYASYGFVMYISKLFNPTYLSTFYPYPYRYLNGNLQGIYYAAPFIAIGIFAVPLYITWKHNKEYFRMVLFGLGFFFTNVVFVLQFISCGAAIMSDRYSYVSYIGLLFMLGYFLYEVTRRFAGVRQAVVGVVLVVSGLFAYLCYERTFVWHDSETLHTDAIEKYPYKAWLSYKWLGNYYFDKGDYTKALDNYNVLAMLGQKDDKVAAKMAFISAAKNGGTGMPVLTNAGPLPPGNYQSYLDSTVAYCRVGDSTRAFRCYLLAFRINQRAEKAIADTSFNCVQRQDYITALTGYGMLLKLNTNNPYYYFYRGIALYGTSQLRAAMADWEIAAQTNVKEVKQSAANNLSVAYDSVGNDSVALYYAMLSKSAGYNVADDFIAKLRARKEQQSRLRAGKR